MAHHFRCLTHDDFLTDELWVACDHLNTHDPRTEIVRREFVPQLRARLDVELVPAAECKRRRLAGQGLRP